MLYIYIADVWFYRHRRWDFDAWLYAVILSFRACHCSMLPPVQNPVKTHLLAVGYLTTHLEWISLKMVGIPANYVDVHRETVGKVWFAYGLCGLLSVGSPQRILRGICWKRCLMQKSNLTSSTTTQLLDQKRKLGCLGSHPEWQVWKLPVGFFGTSTWFTCSSCSFSGKVWAQIASAVQVVVGLLVLAWGGRWLYEPLQADRTWIFTTLWQVPTVDQVLHACEEASQWRLCLHFLQDMCNLEVAPDVITYTVPWAKLIIRGEVVHLAGPCCQLYGFSSAPKMGWSQKTFIFQWKLGTEPFFPALDQRKIPRFRVSSQRFPTLLYLPTIQWSFQQTETSLKLLCSRKATCGCTHTLDKNGSL